MPEPAGRTSGCRTVQRRLLAAATAAVATRQVVGLVQLRSTLSWLGSERDRGCAASQAGDAATLHFVVPVLHEQDHVVPMMNWFATLLQQLPGSTLTVVTSEREVVERRLAERARSSTSPASTADVVAAALREHGWGDRVRHAHYEGGGRKAAQVNHAVEHLDSPGYVAVYDVDSRPSLDLLRPATRPPDRVPRARRGLTAGLVRNPAHPPGRDRPARRPARRLPRRRDTRPSPVPGLARQSPAAAHGAAHTLLAARRAHRLPAGRPIGPAPLRPASSAAPRPQDSRRSRAGLHAPGWQRAGIRAAPMPDHELTFPDTRRERPS